MIDFFIALFGGIFYGTKLLSERLSNSEYNRRSEERKNINESMKQKIVASEELSQEAKEKAFLTKGKTAEYIRSVYEELEDDFKFVFGDDVDIKNLLYLDHNINYNTTLVNRSVHALAYELLLSHKGKVDWGPYIMGFQLGGSNTIERDIRFYQRLEHNLNANGAGVKFYFEPKYSPDTKKYDYDPCYRCLVLEHQVINKNVSKRLW